MIRPMFGSGSVSSTVPEAQWRAASSLLPSSVARGGGARRAETMTRTLAVPFGTCESEQQHVVILVRNKGLPQLEQDHMGHSWYR